MKLFFAISWSIYFFWAWSCFLKRCVLNLRIMFSRESHLVDSVEFIGSLWILWSSYSKPSLLTPSSLENGSCTFVSVSHAFSFALFCGNFTPGIIKHNLLEYFFNFSSFRFNKSLLFVAVRLWDCVSQSVDSKCTTCFFSFHLGYLHWQ